MHYEGYRLAEAINDAQVDVFDPRGESTKLLNTPEVIYDTHTLLPNIDIL